MPTQAQDKHTTDAALMDALKQERAADQDVSNANIKELQDKLQAQECTMMATDGSARALQLALESAICINPAPVKC